MKKRVITISVIIIVLITGIIVFRNKGFSFGTDSSKGKTTAAAPAGSKVSVKVQEAKTIERTSGKTYKATLEAFEEGIVSSKVSAKVVRILFDNGKAVASGDALVVLDEQDIRNQLKSAESQLEASRASLQKLEANLESTQRAYEREKALFDQGATAKAEYENAESALKMANADIASVKASIQSAQVNVDNIRDTLDNTVIRAPIGGLMDGKDVNIGQFVSPGSVLGKVKNISPINAVVEVDQNDINNVKVGQKAKVKVDGVETAFEGVVKSIDVSADPSARVFNCKIQVDNPDRLLKPGTFAKAEISNDRKEKVVAVPIEALNGNEGSYSIFAIENGVARKRGVTIGETDGGMVEVKSGLQEGESVIITNVNMLQDGDAVTVV